VASSFAQWLWCELLGGIWWMGLCDYVLGHCRPCAGRAVIGRLQRRTTLDRFVVGMNPGHGDH
jgi:hypothetical protein